MRDMYISVCYSLLKSKKDYDHIISFKPIHYKETNNFNITDENILEDYESPLKDNQIIFDSQPININVFEYSPKIFSYLRRMDSITPDQMIASFLPSNNKNGISESQGRSGNLFIKTDDNKYILKTINNEELELIKSIFLKQITNHFNDNRNSIIGRIYGIYKIIMPTGFIMQDEIILVLMKNICDSFGDQILAKYDLKGSQLDRSVKFNLSNISNKVMKDTNFIENEGMFYLNEENSTNLTQLIKNDAEFFYKLGIMDYSLLVVKIKLNEDEIKYLFGMDHRKNTEEEYIELTGVYGKEKCSMTHEIEEIRNRPINHDNIRFDKNEIESLRKYIFPSLTPDIMYLFSVIDFFQLYNMQKNLETRMKSIFANKAKISSAPPKEYYERFINEIEKKADCKRIIEKITNLGSLY